MNNTPKPKPHKVKTPKNSKKKSKSKLSTTKLSTTKLSTTKLSKTHTISGLPTAAWMSNVIAAATGLFIFLLGPYLVNSLNAPATSALVNVVPNGLIMALFITESEFHEFFSDLLFAPMFNVILTWIAYPLYYYGYLTALQTIWFEIVIWVGCCVLSYVFKDYLKFS
jgi:hypothetical protein